MTKTQKDNGYIVVRFMIYGGTIYGGETEGIMEVAQVEGTVSATFKGGSSPVDVVVTVGADGCKGYTLSTKSYLGKQGYIVSRWKEVGKNVSEEDVQWKNSEPSIGIEGTGSV